jgi:alpha-2-macroglobulin
MCRVSQAASGPPFFWVLFFGGAKKSTSAVGPRTDFKTFVAKATPNLKFLSLTR